MQYDSLVFIGRFNPFHAGHYHVAKQALKLAENLIFVIGSHDRTRDTRNPFTTAERTVIIRSAFADDAVHDRLHFCPIVDYTYNDERWIAAIQSAVTSVAYTVNKKFGMPKIGLIGYEKDHSSYYLKKFPNWDLVHIEPEKKLSATDLRQLIFRTYWEIDDVLDINDEGFQEFFVNSRHKFVVLTYAAQLQEIADEFEFIENYKKQWANTPYPVTFNTVDAVVTQSGHLLLVTRKAMPGEGLLALPGGFVNQTEKLQEAVIRELREETRLDIPTPALVGSINKVHTYDDPHRSARGRTITTAFHFKLNDAYELPVVKGSDDAKKAQWYSFNEVVVNKNRFFEDHYSIIEHMIGL